jgi:hypothetical protein
MKIKYCSKAIVLLVVLSLALPMSLKAQQPAESADTQQTRTYSQQELDTLLAPIALYPDTLLSQILMASTYPLEVVEADRWLTKNQGLTGDALDAALQQKSWDVSVKSLCHFPRVLASMSDKVQLTNDLGNAFLGQQDQVMDTIQSLRTKAQAQGNLSSTDKLRVTAQEGAIGIEPVSPEVVYVPAYNPCWAYGPWWYPACAPLWFWYPDFVISAGFFFGPAIFIGPLGPWCGFRWHRHELFVDFDRASVFHRPSITGMHGGRETWAHNPVHRRGISYRSPDIGRRFGQMQRPGVDARRSFRGFVAPEGRGSAAGLSPQTRPERGRLTTLPRNIGPGGKQIEQPARPQQARPQMQRQSNAPGLVGRPSAQPQRGNAFESFGSSGREVIQHSNRGFNSMGGATRGGGGFQGGATRSDGGPHGGSQRR